MANNDKRYEKPENGEEALVSTRNTWTTQLGDRSVAACYAVIAAAWENSAAVLAFNATHFSLLTSQKI